MIKLMILKWISEPHYPTGSSCHKNHYTKDTELIRVGRERDVKKKSRGEGCILRMGEGIQDTMFFTKNRGNTKNLTKGEDYTWKSLGKKAPANTLILILIN